MKAVSPLKRLLMITDLEHLLSFLHQLGIQYTISRQIKGHYYAAIYREGMVRYQSSSPNSPKSALCDALAAFLVGEKKDYHEYQVQPVERSDRIAQHLGLLDLEEDDVLDLPLES